MRIRWVAAMVLVALGGGVSTASAEESPRVLFWATDGVGEDVAARATERVADLGRVVELPPAAVSGITLEARRLEAASSAVVEDARNAYYEARFADAVAALTAHLAQAGPALAAAGALDALRSTLLWLGASLAKVDRADDAVEQFLLAIALGLDEIDRSLFPPEVTTAYDRARAEAGGRPTTPIEVSVSPEGVTLEVDGEAIDDPLESLQRGRHVVVARRFGFVTSARIVDVGAEPIFLDFELEPAGREELLRQIAHLRHVRALDPDDGEHRALLARATDASFVALVMPQWGDVVLLHDASGALTDWPDLEEPESSEPDAGVAAMPVDPLPDATEARPVWRRWWFWVALVGGAAVVATGVGLGVAYGGEETFRIVPPEPRGR